LTPAKAEFARSLRRGAGRLPGAALDEARRAFEAALKAVPDDGPSLTFVKRLDASRPPRRVRLGWRVDLERK